MFLVKSAFWLGLAYVVVTHDPGTITAAANSATAKAAAAGRQIIATGIAANPCLFAGCAAVGGPSDAQGRSPAAMPTPAGAGFAIPTPRPRPPRLG